MRAYFHGLCWLKLKKTARDSPNIYFNRVFPIIDHSGNIARIVLGLKLFVFLNFSYNLVNFFLKIC